MAKPCTLAPEAASRLLKYRVQALRKPLDAVRAEDADGIHDMRVASRRLRATLAEHSAAVDKGPLDSFRKETRGITRLLGTARELDVTLDILERLRKGFHGPARHAVVFVVRRLRAKRRSESEAVAKCADRVASPEFDRALMAIFESLKPQRQCYIRAAAQNLQTRYQALYRLYGLWEGVPSDEILHRIRISFKKFRYACESYKPLYEPDMSAFLPELKAAQEALGIWNDFRILRDYALGLAPEAPPRAKQGMPELIAAVEGDVAACLEGFGSSAKVFFSHQRARDILAFLGKPQFPCCRSKAPDPAALDQAYEKA